MKLLCWWVELERKYRRAEARGLRYLRCHREQQTFRGLCLKHNRIWESKRLAGDKKL